jgi:hypothetical protein
MSTKSPPPIKCCFCGKVHPIKQICPERLKALADQRRKSDTKRKGWRQ